MKHEQETLTRDDVSHFVHDSDRAIVLIRGRRVVDLNTPAEEMLAASSEAMIGKPLNSLFVEPFAHPEQGADADDRLFERLHAGLPVAVGVPESRAKEGKTIEVVCSELRPVDDEALLLGAIREVSARPEHEPLDRHRNFQTLLLELADRFATASAAELEGTIRAAMSDIVDRYAVDRMSIWWLDAEKRCARAALQVGVNAKPSEELVGPFSRLPWLVSRLYSPKRELILVPDDLPEDAEEERAYFRDHEVAACLIAPVSIDSKVVGVAAVSSISGRREWSKQDRVELALLCGRLGGTWIKHLADRRAAAREADLEKRAAFQTRLARVATDFATSPTDDVHELIDQTLAELAAGYGFDRASLWRLDPESLDANMLHEWAAKPAYRTDDGQQRLAELPYLASLVPSGSVTGPVFVPDDLPAHAAADRAYFERRGVKSSLIFPVVINGEFTTVFGVAALTERREWNERERTELTLLTHTITSACLQRISTQKIRESEVDLARSQRVAAVGSFSVFASTQPPIADDNAVIRISAEAARLFDVPHGEETLPRMLQRIHPDDRGHVYRMRSQSLKDGSGLTLDYRVVRSDGSVIHIEDRAEVDRDESGQIVRLFGTYQDVTDRTKAQKELEQALLENEQLRERLQAENVVLREEARAAKSFGSIVGDSTAMRGVLAAARKVAPTNVPVLILGETGTGKELVARAVHAQSDRRSASLISVNCAALSSELIESELFGHEVGAFTGAHRQRQGRFELADQATLFLDEIGDLPLEAQAKLLRVLQTGELQRLGGNRTRHVDVRVIVATNRDLVSMMERGTFRADLYFRINSFPIVLPPLRERPEDIPALANYFVEKHAAKLGKNVRSISAETIEHLLQQTWPGNVRELEGYVQRALISSEGAVLHHLEVPSMTPTPDELGPNDAASEEAEDLESMQRRHIQDVLESCDWVIGGERGAATALGIPPSSLRSRMKRLGISRP